MVKVYNQRVAKLPLCLYQHHTMKVCKLMARLHGSPRLINAVESTKVNRVNSSFQRK